MSAITHHFLAAAILIAVLACNRTDAPVPGTAPGNHPAPGSTVDSILPIEESLRRFREGLAVVTELGTAAPSRDSLVNLVIGLLERNDSSGLAATLITRAEYAYLYYPTSVYATKPYELAPDIAWLLSVENSQKGGIRLIQRLGGRSLEVTGYRCGDALTEGVNRIWRDCAVSFTDPGSSTAVTRRLFGAIIERNGRFKILSFANDF